LQGVSQESKSTFVLREARRCEAEEQKSNSWVLVLELKSIKVAKNETEESQLLVFLLVASVSFYQKQEPSVTAEREIRNIYGQTQVLQCEDAVFIWIRPRKVVSRRENGHRSVSVYPSPGAGLE
jgi:hypothetical protein